jgi:hypothetical protein
MIPDVSRTVPEIDNCWAKAFVVRRQTHAAMTEKWTMDFKEELLSSPAMRAHAYGHTVETEPSL